MPPLLLRGQAKAGPRSPYGPAAEGESNYVRAADSQAPRSPSDLPPLSAVSRRPLEGGFPKSKSGLPRGRVVEPPATLRCGSSDTDGEGYDTDDEDTGPILPAWPSFDNAAHRHSAMPPSL